MPIWSIDAVAEETYRGVSLAGLSPSDRSLPTHVDRERMTLAFSLLKFNCEEALKLVLID